MSLESLFSDALNHWRELETSKAKEILEYVAKHNTAFSIEGWSQDAASMLHEVRPDRDETVLIAIGSGVLPQLQDRDAAERLRDAINRKGRPFRFRWAAIVTDSALLRENVYRRCPIISVGGGIANQFTVRMEDSLREDASRSRNVHIQHSTKPDERHIALWGDSADETAAAVEMFVTSELLDDFLASIWD